MRRQPLRTLWARGTQIPFAHGRAGKLLVVAVLIVIPTGMLLQSLHRLSDVGTHATTYLGMNLLTLNR